MLLESEGIPMNSVAQMSDEDLVDEVQIFFWMQSLMILKACSLK